MTIMVVTTAIIMTMMIICTNWRAQSKEILRKSRCGWKDNIKIDLREIGCEGMDWIHLAQDRDHSQALVNTVMTLQVP
jgi:hypothetical protein